jgi:nicotinate phosphoribosyltransferase
MEPSSALKTDHYELTMLAAALGDGTAGLRAVFEVFGRKLAHGRRYGVVGGLGRLLDEIEAFRFTPEQLAFLDGQDFVDPRTLEFLAAYRFRGDVIAYREGELYFPGSPVLTVEGTFGEAVLLETLVLSVLNHDSAIASAAARMVDVADGRRMIEMGGRRTHEEAAVAAARMAYLTGFDASSNLEAGHRHGIPTTGTAAHAFTLAHPSERSAFASQIDALGTGTTLLVDTYDIADAIRTGVELAVQRGATGPGAIRIDSGDLVVEATKARALLDELGAVDTRIVVSSDLDEYLIEDLVERGAPIDGFGVGTKLVGGSGHPTAGFVYKLVAIAEHDSPDAAMRPVAKRSASKLSIGGRKRALRIRDDEGFAVLEDVTVHDEPFEAPPTDGSGRALQVVAVRDGVRLHRPEAAEIRAHHRRALAELRPLHRQIVAGGPALEADPRPITEPQPSRSDA